ncbi:MAG: exo-alpha-sialidase [candidate division KSB1 bacterium]|nr:exo-alpha-sialidase [candidate division KSB1 bacterium]
MTFRFVVFIATALTLTVPLLGREVRIEHQRGYLSAEFIFPPYGPPTPMCHAATLVETREGILAAWYGGSAEGAEDVGIWSARLTASGWSEPTLIAEGITESGRVACWNPVLFQPRQGPLLLFYKIGSSPSDWRAVLKTSTDEGFTWSEAVPLPEGVLGPIKNKPMELADGTLLCGSSREKNGWEVVMHLTSDLKKWRTVGPLPKPKSWQVIQPTLLRYKDGSIHALCRSKQGFIVDSFSKDGGLTWSYMERTKFPNPNSAIDGIDLKDGRHLLVYNADKQRRTPLIVAIGNKRGTAWKKVLRLEEAPGEYSYPAVIQSRDGLVHILYTWNRQSIKHVVIDPNRL